MVSVLAGTLACFALGLASLSGQSSTTSSEPFRASIAVADKNQPISIFADRITTFKQGNEQVFRLEGKVWVEQGLASVKMPNGVAWYRVEQTPQGNLCQVEVFGEGNSQQPVSLEQGGQKHETARAVIKLAAGEVRLKSYTSKIENKDVSSDALVKRALAVRTPSRTTPRVDNNIVQAGGPNSPQQAGVTPIPVTAAPTGQPIQQAQFEQPATGNPSTNPQFTPPPPPSWTQGETPFAPSPRVVPLNPGAGTPPPPPPMPGTPSLLTPVPDDSKQPRQLNIRPRSSQPIQAIKQLMPNGETAIVVPSGVILTVTNPREGKVLVDMEADRIVFWTRDGAGGTGDMFGNMQRPSGESSPRRLEFYLSGNVEIRNQVANKTQTMRAQSVYYDVNRNVAVALKGSMQFESEKTSSPVVFKADELLQLGPKKFEGRTAEVFSSKLPSDPGIKVEIETAELIETDRPRTNIFGQLFYDPATGQPRTTPQRYVTGQNAIIRMGGVPVFWLPYFKTDPEDPLGPLDNINVSFSRMFGVQLQTTWDIYDLLGVIPDDRTRWKLYADYLGRRGPALGTLFQTAGKDLFGIQNNYEASVKAYGIYDQATDILGGDRGTQAFLFPPPEPNFVPITHGDWRGRATGKINIFDLPNGFTFQGQVSGISDQNFLEQYFYQEWINDLNQETFAYLKQQQGIWAWNVLVEPRIREWITETEWLPKAEGHIIGAKLFDLITTNTKASAGYGRLKPTSVPSFAYQPNDQNVDAGRFDIWHESSLPFDLGPFRVVPYLTGDLAYYTNDLTRESRGRAYLAFGVRSSLPFSRYYPEMQSELFNVNGIFHKIVFSSNYFNANTNTHISDLPQMDRFNDDASDQALRDISPRQYALNPANANFLTTSLLVDPQYYGLRRLIDSRVDSIDTIDVFQMGVRQRWQTKRGFPGKQHVVDWMTLDVQASLFPHSQRDNFGQLFGVINYDWRWNIGDRTALVSNGWFETVEDGPRVFNFGGILNRPDGTSFYLGYRQIDPLNSKAVVASLTYAMSAKYAVTASTVYDFGVDNQTNTFTITRMGTDLMVSMGFSYNSVLQNVGVVFQVVPNLIPGAGRRMAGVPGQSATGF